MFKRFHLDVKSAPARFATPGPTGIIEGDGCLNCSNCVKKFCVYSVYEKRRYDGRQMFDTADSLCKNCYRCVQGCYGRILSKSRNPEFRLMGNDYWKPEIIATTQSQAETGKIPVSGGGYGGPFAGAGFDSMWTDMSEIVRPTRDGIHGREYISTAVTLGCMPENPGSRVDSPADGPAAVPPPRVDLSIPMIFDLLPFGGYSTVFSAMAAAAREANTLMIVPAGLWTGELLSFSRHLIPMLPDGSPGGLGKALDGVRMVEIPLQRDVSCRIQALKERRPDLVVSVRVPVTPAAKREAEALTHSGVEVIHFVAEGDGREYDASSPRFIKDVIREVHLSLVAQGLRDRVTLIFGGGIALAEHVGKAVICGADAVSLERPLLIALECRLCGQCAQGRFCPVELENIQPRWGRQRIVNLMAAWHGQLLEVLGAMGLRDLRRMRGEAGRAIFREEIEKDTFGRLFGPPVMRDDREGEGGSHVLAT